MCTRAWHFAVVFTTRCVAFCSGVTYIHAVLLVNECSGLIIPKMNTRLGSYLLTWCFKPSQSQRITSGLNGHTHTHTHSHTHKHTRTHTQANTHTHI